VRVVPEVMMACSGVYVTGVISMDESTARKIAQIMSELDQLAMQLHRLRDRLDELR